MRSGKKKKKKRGRRRKKEEDVAEKEEEDAMKAGDEASCAGQPQRPLAAAATRAPGRRVSQLQPRSMSGSPGGPSLGGRGGQPRLGGDGAGLHRPPPSRAALPRPRRRPPPSAWLV
ncbi:unnamed protein product [Prorocentrum cordatum]|uniref:Uncharacterized protein n=2 Tax=Prorocentrum cordatum TaxID=2364126 RepID=A0ABN9XSU6_9DINO|nr:unnamed protein product [Polarella glacialis]